jgi:hypothetical protein
MTTPADALWRSEVRASALFGTPIAFGIEWNCAGSASVTHSNAKRESQQKCPPSFGIKQNKGQMRS